MAAPASLIRFLIVGSGKRERYPKDVTAGGDVLGAASFTTPPTAAWPVTIAVLLDTCGNLIQIYQPPRG